MLMSLRRGLKAVTEHIQIANKPAIERYINDGPGRYARCKTLLELHQLGIIDLDSKQKDVLHEIISVLMISMFPLMSNAAENQYMTKLPAMHLILVKI